MTQGAPYERGRLPLVLILGGLIGMGLLNWRLATADIDISPASASGGAAEPAQLSAADWTPDDAATPGDAAAYPQMLARPLFRASRRPPDAAQPQIAGPSGVTAPQAVARLPEDIQLVGIMLPTGGAGRALIRSGGSPAGQWVEIGHVLEGWRVSQIEASSVLFETNGAKRQLSLFPPKER